MESPIPRPRSPHPLSALLNTAAAALLFFSFGAAVPSPLAASEDSAPDPVPLAHEGSDIPADPAVTWGLLPNGMRYAILPNAEPPERVSLRLYVDAGSLMERDDQQGLAHFLEHMAFNGTENFPAGEMVEYFQRLGMGFGNHTNAHTSFHETVYKLELPDNTEAMLGEGFQLLRDYADGMLLLQEEIDDERGIILSEKRTRDSVGWRTFVEQIAFAFPDHLVADRLPIGIEKVIREADRDRFADFYRDWYTPNRMVLVAVGDIEPEQVEALVRKHFEDLPAREKTPAPDLGTVSERGLSAHYHYEKEAGETSVSIESLVPRENPPDNRERRRHDMRLTLANDILGLRLDRLAKDEDAPISSAAIHGGDFYSLNFARYGGIYADCKPGDWEDALALIEQELRRALEFGFTEAELAQAKADMLHDYEEAAKQMATRKSAALANTLASRIGARRVFTSPEQDLPRVREELEKVTAEECREELVTLWKGSKETLLYVDGNAVIEGDDPAAAILAAHERSAAQEIAPPEEEEAAAFSYTELPEPGRIAEREDIEDLGVTQLRFENQVRVNLKPTDFEKETIRVKARVGGGLLTEPKDRPGLARYSGSILDGGGLEAHSEEDLQRIFAGQSVEVGIGTASDAFVFGGTTNAGDLRDQLLLMRAYLTHPGYRKEADTEFRRGLDSLYEQLARTPTGVYTDRASRFLHGGDPRFGYPEREVLESYTPDDAREWLEGELDGSYLELTLVGDFDREEAISLVAETFGSLPERAAEKPAYTEERKVAFPGATDRVFPFPTSIPKGMAVVQWPTTDYYEIHKTRRLGMLGAIFSDRLRVKVREELGDAYSPSAHNAPSDTWSGYGSMIASVVVDPGQAESVRDVIAGISEELATGDAIGEDELERALKPVLTSLEERVRDNGYWMGSVLEASQEYPQRLDWARNFVEDYRSINARDINALAKEYLRADKRVSLLIVPEEESAESAVPASSQ